MTRINAVPVEELSNEHLLGENREITRVYNLALPTLEVGFSLCFSGLFSKHGRLSSIEVSGVSLSVSLFVYLFAVLEKSR